MKPIMLFLNASMCALNIGMYVWAHRPFSAAAAVLSGLMVLFVLSWD